MKQENKIQSNEKKIVKKEENLSKT